MPEENDFDLFIEEAAENLKREFELRFNVLPKEYSDRLASNLINWLEAHLTKHRATPHGARLILKRKVMQMFDIPQHFTNEIIRQSQQTRDKLDRIIELLELLTQDTKQERAIDVCPECFGTGLENPKLEVGVACFLCGGTGKRR